MAAIEAPAVALTASGGTAGGGLLRRGLGGLGRLGPLGRLGSSRLLRRRRLLGRRLARGRGLLRGRLLRGRRAARAALGGRPLRRSSLVGGVLGLLAAVLRLGRGRLGRGRLAGTTAGGPGGVHGALQGGHQVDYLASAAVLVRRYRHVAGVPTGELGLDQPLHRLAVVVLE